MVWIFSYQQIGTVLNRINYRHLPPARNRMADPFIFSKSNLLNYLSQATFSQCYITQCPKLKNLVSSDGLDFFPINKPKFLSTESIIGIYPRIRTAYITLLSLPNNSVFSALIVSRILYALPAFYGFILQSDVDRIDAMFRKAKRWGITTDEFNMDFFSTLSDSRLFKNIKFDQHCLHHLLPQVHEVPSYNLRGRPTSYNIPRAKISKLLNSFIYRCANLNY